jgi:quercetin dioxygenase-like cupin family protein
MLRVLIFFFVRTNAGSSTHEAVMGVAEIAPGAPSERHRHRGIEIGDVLEGSIRLEQEGRPPRALVSQR